MYSAQVTHDHVEVTGVTHGSADAIPVAVLDIFVDGIPRVSSPTNQKELSASNQRESSASNQSATTGSGVQSAKPSDQSLSSPKSLSSASSLPSETSVCRLCLLTEEEAEESLIRLLCLCKGSVRFIHKSCAKRWINARGNRSDCEMCGGQMITESILERCCRRTSTRLRNASYKETVIAFSLLAFLFWLFSYCIYLFAKGLTDILSFEEARHHHR